MIFPLWWWPCKASILLGWWWWMLTKPRRKDPPYKGVVMLEEGPSITKVGTFVMWSWKWWKVVLLGWNMMGWGDGGIRIELCEGNMVWVVGGKGLESLNQIPCRKALNSWVEWVMKKKKRKRENFLCVWCDGGTWKSKRQSRGKCENTHWCISILLFATSRKKMGVLFPFLLSLVRVTNNS